MSTATSSSGKRVIIVTGAAEGIGRSIAETLAQDGFDLGLFDLPRAKDRLEELAESLRRAHQTRVSTVYGDVSKEDDVKGLVDTVVKDLGGLYGMVANAGVVMNRALHETTTEEFDRIISINVNGVFFCYKYAALQLIKQGKGGRIVGAASIASKRGLPLHSAYCASKFAVRGLTQAAALDFGKYGITVNTYSPGTIETSMLRGLVELHDKEGKKGAWLENTFQNAMGHVGKPQDIASVVSFFVSDRASYVTGQSYTVDGGFHFD